MKMLKLKNIQKRNGWISASCPFAAVKHEKGKDDHPSFGVSEEGIYNCFTCGSKGTIVSLVEKLYMLYGDFTLIEKALPIAYELFNNKPTVIVKDTDDSYIPEIVYSSFKKFNASYRCLSKETLSDFDIRTDGSRLLIPIRDSYGSLVCIKGRSLNDEIPKYKVYFRKDYKSRGILYGMDKTPERSVAILVEGELDRLALYEIGVKNVLATGGATITKEQMKTFSLYFGIILFLDNDAAGIALKNELLKKQRNIIGCVNNYYGFKDAMELLENKKLNNIMEEIQ